MRRKFRDLTHHTYMWWANFVYRAFPWTVVFTARKHYGYDWGWILQAYRSAEASEESTVLGSPVTRAVDFFSKCARRADDESVLYRCVFNACTVQFHPKRGVTGGWGRAGCPCDDLDEPRDLERGPIRGEA